jgi:hypothetical protein
VAGVNVPAMAWKASHSAREASGSKHTARASTRGGRSGRSSASSQGWRWVTCRQASRTRTAPSNQQGPEASSVKSGRLRSRLSPPGVTAPNRNLPRSLRWCSTMPQANAGRCWRYQSRTLSSCSRKASTTSGDGIVPTSGKGLPHRPGGGTVASDYAECGPWEPGAGSWEAGACFVTSRTSALPLTPVASRS